MTAVSVGADNLRADPMDTTINVGGIGGGAGAGVEDEAYYQNGAAISRKVTGAGFFTDTGAPRNMTVSGRQVVLYKVLVTNFAGITNLEIRLGSANNAYSQYILADNSTLLYKALGGFLIVAIDPSETGYRDSVVGSPSFSATDYFGIFANGPVSKAENLVMDAVDVGYGLYLTAGTAPDAAGEFSDYVADDEGDDVNGRYGYVTSVGGIPFVLGKLVKGATTTSGSRTAAATRFSDVGGTIVWLDSFTAPGFSGIVDDLSNASTDIRVRKALSSVGNETTTDTRAVYEAFGTSGVADYSLSSFENWASFLLTSGCDFSGVTFSDCGLITAALGLLDSAAVSGSTSSAAVLWDEATDPDTYLADMIFTGNSNHAIEFGTNTPLTINLSGQSYSGYNTTLGSNLVANSGPSDATIYNNSGKAITLNLLAGGGGVSVRNGVGSTTTVVSGLVTVQVVVYDDATGLPLEDANVRLLKDSDKSVILSGTSNASGVVSDSIAYTADTPVVGWARQWDISGEDYTPKDISGTITSTGLTLEVRLTPI